jgi:hypothetical protein
MMTMYLSAQASEVSHVPLSVFFLQMELGATKSGLLLSIRTETQLYDSQDTGDARNSLSAKWRGLHHSDIPRRAIDDEGRHIRRRWRAKDIVSRRRSNIDITKWIYRSHGGSERGNLGKKETDVRIRREPDVIAIAWVKEQEDKAKKHWNRTLEGEECSCRFVSVCDAHWPIYMSSAAAAA